jgi:hypothetical protein
MCGTEKEQTHMNAYPTAPAIKDPVRIPLPANMGSAIVSEGITYTADAAGILTLPRAVAEELAPQLLQPEAVPQDIAALVDAIKSIDEELATLRRDHAALEVAESLAGERLGVAAEPGPSVQELTAKHRRTLGDYILGLVKRADVEAVEKQRQQAAAKASEQAKANELAAMGREELRARKQPIEQRARELEERRTALRNRAIRADAEHAGADLRAAAIAFGDAFARVHAYALLLRDDKSLRPAYGNIELPAFPQLQAFADCGGSMLALTFEPGTFRAGSAHELIDLGAARSAVQQHLAQKGIPV